ncbi:MAG TPA: helix-turn-helix transcriptional regulator [Sphingomonas sp.]|nr:helix-turn-helix transcriptional regulator [Sphingomonas sp.]
MSDDVIHEGSGNVFADLGFADPATHKLKAELVRRLDSILKSRGLSQSAAARLIGVGQPDLSKLLNGRFREMSVERLLRMLTRLDCDVDINVQFDGQTVGDAIHLDAVAA